MPSLPKERASKREISAVLAAEVARPGPQEVIPSPPTAQAFMWAVGLLALALILLVTGLHISIYDPFSVENPSKFLDFALLLITAVICRYYYFRLKQNISLSLSMLVAQAAFLIFPAVPAALVGAISACWFELFIRHRKLGYIVRSAGTYTICAIVARLVYERVGGSAILGDINLVVVGQAFVAFLVYRILNELILFSSQYLQNLPAWNYLVRRVTRVAPVYLAMLLGSLLLAVLKFQVGSVGLLLACGTVVLVSVILRSSSLVSLNNAAQMQQLQALNQRLGFQNERQTSLGEHINQTLDSFMALVRDYAATSHEQESAVIEINATIEQLSQTARLIALSADNVSTAAEKAIFTAHQGQDAVNSTISAILEVRNKVEEIAAKIEALNAKSFRISEIIATINAIAGEIRLIALNATIEASGAGTFGKRFAVVAVEVNRLADRSREAVQQVREIIAEIQFATQSSVQVTEEGLQRMERVMTTVQKSDEANLEIINVVQETAQVAAAISLATQQQRNASEMAVNSIHEVTLMIGQNAEKIANVSVASLELQRFARELKN